MRSNYEVLGKHIRLVDSRNKDEITSTVLGISIDKEFMPSVANVIGTDLSRYKLIQKGMFACNPMHVGRDERLPIALYKDDIPAIVSPAYFMFEIIDPAILDMDYLMMWFRRPEFDRECWFMTDGSVRGGIAWDNLCRISIPVPTIERQRSIVKAYQTITDRIALKRKINENLLALTNAIFSKMFLQNKSQNTIPFTNIVQLMGGGTPKTDQGIFWDGSIPFFTPKDVSSSPFCISTEKRLSVIGLKSCSSHLYPMYTTFITCRGTVGNLSMAGVPMAMNQSCYAIKGKNKYPPFFVYSFARYVIATMRNKASGAVFNALVTRDFEMEKVFEPDLNDAIKYQRLVAPIFDQILSNTREIKSLIELSQILLMRLSR